MVVKRGRLNSPIYAQKAARERATRYVAVQDAGSSLRSEWKAKGRGGAVAAKTQLLPMT